MLAGIFTVMFGFRNRAVSWVGVFTSHSTDFRDFFTIARRVRGFKFRNSVNAQTTIQILLSYCNLRKAFLMAKRMTSIRFSGAQSLRTGAGAGTVCAATGVSMNSTSAPSQNTLPEQTQIVLDPIQWALKENNQAVSFLTSNTVSDFTPTPPVRDLLNNFRPEPPPTV
jgi:hypothetical protein